MEYATIKSDDKIDYKFKEYIFILMKVESERKKLQEEKEPDERDDRTREREGTREREMSGKIGAWARAGQGHNNHFVCTLLHGFLFYIPKTI